MEPDRHYTLKLALACPRFSHLSGLDGRRHGVGSASSVTMSRSLRGPRGTFDGWRRTHETCSRRQVVPCGATSKDFVPHVGTKLGPEINLASPAFLWSAKGAVSPPRPTSC